MLISGHGHGSFDYLRSWLGISLPAASVVEAIAKLHINLPWVVPVKSAKRQAVIQLHAAVGDVQSIQGNGVFLGEACRITHS